MHHLVVHCFLIQWMEDPMQDPAEDHPEEVGDQEAVLLNVSTVSTSED